MLKAGPYYKIGKTNNFSRRITELTIQLPFPVEVVHKIYTNNTTANETYWHKRFSHRRVNGEWFSLTDSDVTEFKKHSSM